MSSHLGARNCNEEVSNLGHLYAGFHTEGGGGGGALGSPPPPRIWCHNSVILVPILDDRLRNAVILNTIVG